jgi:predicted DNA-binding transcriptional regulator AlpA
MAMKNLPFPKSLSINGKQTYVGSFESEIEAAIAWDKAVAKVDAEHARFNFPRKAG